MILVEAQEQKLEEGFLDRLRAGFKKPSSKWKFRDPEEHRAANSYRVSPIFADRVKALTKAKNHPDNRLNFSAEDVRRKYPSRHIEGGTYRDVPKGKSDDFGSGGSEDRGTYVTYSGGWQLDNPEDYAKERERRRNTQDYFQKEIDLANSNRDEYLTQAKNTRAARLDRQQKMAKAVNRPFGRVGRSIRNAFRSPKWWKGLAQ